MNLRIDLKINWNVYSPNNSTEDPGTNKSVLGKAITVSHRGRTLRRIFKAKYSHLGCFHQSSLAIYWITQVSYLSHESGPHETIQSIANISHLRITSLSVYLLPELTDHITSYSRDTADTVHLKHGTVFKQSRWFWGLNSKELYSKVL